MPSQNSQVKQITKQKSGRVRIGALITPMRKEIVKAYSTLRNSEYVAENFNTRRADVQDAVLSHILDRIGPQPETNSSTGTRSNVIEFPMMRKAGA